RHAAARAGQRHPCPHPPGPPFGDFEMNRLLPAAALGLLALATPLRAEDPRLLSRLFHPQAVVRIDGRVNVETTIRFGEDELIENVAIGDSNGWQVTPNKRANLLFV